MLLSILEIALISMVTDLFPGKNMTSKVEAVNSELSMHVKRAEDLIKEADDADTVASSVTAITQRSLYIIMATGSETDK